MRIEDIFTQAVNTKNLRAQQKQVEDNAYVPVEPVRDTVTISRAVAEARQSGVDLARAAKEAQAQDRQKKQDGNAAPDPAEGAAEMSPARQAFKAYMDKATGRVPSPPKTPEEKLEELAEKMKKLKNQLSEVMSDTSMPENVKSSRMETINSQIKATQEQIDQIGKEMAEQAAA